METRDLGVVEVKMKQNIEDQEVKMDKNDEKPTTFVPLIERLH